MRGRPHPRACFFQQAVLERQIGDHLLQRVSLAPQLPHLIRGRLARCIARQAFLADFKKVFRPPVIEILANALASAQLGDARLAAQPSTTILIFSSAEYRLRVARRIL
jgi:hypothetical protein